MDCKSPKSRNFSPPIEYIEGSAERIARIKRNAIVKTVKDSANLLIGSTGLFRKKTPKDKMMRETNPTTTVEKLNENWPIQ